ncbi:hypothetical protein BGW36DRAFT_63138 [Talaromyces proteolyticus]|uniref:Uncharacterized protein n=1 Tax=Talaromyces proteolyticus TaxID=1131652 RepID=A0AAD4PV80_9EURO|nr:uncharacterized protein BGW36DRAFT_63138 [Talaromyces proteolyticus]KAH8690969.1 hypothetical protein BGW36DRAFT_63138 [Talaromyces proteolyticus]
MRLLSTPLLFLHLLAGYVVCQATELPSSADIFYWPLTSPQPSLLAKISYDPRTLDSNVLSYTPPSLTTPREDSSETTQNLVRVGFFTSSSATRSKQWVGSLVSQSALSTGHRQKLHLYLSPADDLYHVSLSAHPEQSVDGNALDVDIVFPDAGALPELNKPIVVNPDGTNTEEPEKTFLQKYVSFPYAMFKMVVLWMW